MQVSVIVPIYNSYEYLADCLASIERQTLGDIEVLCIDDASDDDSVELCRTYAKDDQRIRIIELPENGGAARARNIGMDIAQGEYIAFMDADDWYPNDDALESLYRAASENNAIIAGGSIDRYDVDTGSVLDVGDDPHLACFNFDREGFIDYRDWQFDYGFTRFIYQRDFLMRESIRFPEIGRHEDPVFLVRCMVAAGRFYAIPKLVYRIRMGYKQFGFTEKQVDEALEGISAVLAISYEHDLPQLRHWQKELMRQYVVGSPGILSEFFLKDLAHEGIRRIGQKVRARFSGTPDIDGEGALHD